MAAEATAGRLILDAPQSGVWNMSVDQALLETAEQSGLVSLRIYQWSQATLSLGYFQSHADRQQHPASEDCPLVRRRTGGGAIVHDRELTYSLTVPSQNRWASQNSELYDLVHRLLIEILRESFGFDSRLYSETQTEASSREGHGNSPGGEATDSRPNASVIQVDPEAFLCFQRRSDGDVVSSGHKIIGSAQRRLKNSLLQHGSILLGRSEFAPELPGIDDLHSQPVNIGALVDQFAEATANCLGIRLEPGHLSESEREAAETYRQTMFGQDDWNRKR